MMALELLLKQLPSIKQQLKESSFDPYEMLSCKYLRLSSNNIKTLVEMCRETGLNVDYHPHMASTDPIILHPFRPRDESVNGPSAIPRRLSPDADTPVLPPVGNGQGTMQKLKKGLPNAD
jgi:hypothetical protein